MKKADILIKPLITEKITELGEKFNKYGFVVDRRANKLEIKGAVEDMYGVTVKGVNTTIIPGKAKVRYTKRGFSRGQTKAYKKAIITLAEGEVIDFFNT